MIIQCKGCSAKFDDELRTTICPHGTFMANDGQNNFRRHTESLITHYCNYPDCDGGPETGYCHTYCCPTWKWTPEELEAFEQDIAAEFNAGKIRAPIHLDGGNEQQLIDIFKWVQPQDWVCGSWRMHYKCLLKGVPPALLKEEIMAGRSITLCLPEYRIISSAIVGGIVPIALGLADAIQRRGSEERVHLFVGDMTARSGMFWECVNYAAGHGLIGNAVQRPGGMRWEGGPLRIIVEDNNLSVCTPTRETWGANKTPIAMGVYEYKLAWPHSGAGRRVEF